ncbi:MAG: hypothetical protein KDK33_06445 [Leptospiraceae bacterium]|nr:hypothetical protein [Leptospiraceae bacterium]
MGFSYQQATRGSHATTNVDVLEWLMLTGAAGTLTGLGIQNKIRRRVFLSAGMILLLFPILFIGALFLTEGMFSTAGNPIVNFGRTDTFWIAAIVAALFLCAQSGSRRVRLHAQWIWHIASIGFFFAFLVDIYSISKLPELRWLFFAGLFCVSIGASVHNPALGVTGIMVRNESGSIVARRLLPSMVFVLT